MPDVDVVLVLLRDEPIEILSAWSTEELARGEIRRLLDTKCENGRPIAPDWYWFNNRLDIVVMHVNQVSKPV